MPKPARAFSNFNETMAGTGTSDQAENDKTLV
jgi:hypothetical protein